MNQNSCARRVSMESQAGYRIGSTHGRQWDVSIDPHVFCRWAIVDDSWSKPGVRSWPLIASATALLDAR